MAELNDYNVKLIKAMDELIGEPQMDVHIDNWIGGIYDHVEDLLDDMSLNQIKQLIIKLIEAPTKPVHNLSPVTFWCDFCGGTCTQVQDAIIFYRDNGLIGE